MNNFISFELHKKNWHLQSLTVFITGHFMPHFKMFISDINHTKISYIQYIYNNTHLSNSPNELVLGILYHIAQSYSIHTGNDNLARF